MGVYTEIELLGLTTLDTLSRLQRRSNVISRTSSNLTENLLPKGNRRNSHSPQSARYTSWELNTVFPPSSATHTEPEEIANFEEYCKKGDDFTSRDSSRTIGRTVPFAMRTSYSTNCTPSEQRSLRQLLNQNSDSLHKLQIATRSQRNNSVLSKSPHNSSFHHRYSTASRNSSSPLRSRQNSDSTNKLSIAS